MLAGFFGGLEEACTKSGLGAQEQAALVRMGRLWAVCEVERNLGEFILAGGVSADEVRPARSMRRRSPARATLPRELCAFASKHGAERLQ